MWPNLWGSNMWPYIYSTREEGEEQRRYPGKMPSLERPIESRVKRVHLEWSARASDAAGAPPEEKKKKNPRCALLGVCSSTCLPNGDESRRRRKRIHTESLFVSFRSSYCFTLCIQIVSYQSSSKVRPWEMKIQVPNIYRRRRNGFLPWLVDQWIKSKRFRK